MLWGHIKKDAWIQISLIFFSFLYLLPPLSVKTSIISATQKES